MVARSPVLLLAAIILVAVGPTLQARVVQDLYILEIASRGCLCAYTSQAQWAAVPKEKVIEFAAIAHFQAGHVISVLVERYSEDATTYDEYTIGSEENVLRLKRTLDMIPGRVTREQIWDI